MKIISKGDKKCDLHTIQRESAYLTQKPHRDRASNINLLTATKIKKIQLEENLVDFSSSQKDASGGETPITDQQVAPPKIPNASTAARLAPVAFCIWKLNSFISESKIDKKLEEFQKALYRHQPTTPDTKNYDPDAMQQFTDKNSPGLFQDLLTCITEGRSLTEKRRQLQEDRKSVV